MKFGLLEVLTSLSAPPHSAAYVTEVVNAALCRAAGRYGLSREDHLRSHRALGKWNNATAAGRWPAVAQLMLTVGVTLDDLIDRRPCPWDRLDPGSTVVVFVGQRYTTTADAELLERASNSAFDLQAVHELAALLNRIYRLDVLVEIVPVDNSADWDLLLTRWSHAALLVVLGSPRVNSICAAAAASIFGPESPVRFHYAAPVTGDATYLCATCPPDEERIQHGETCYPRVHDSLVRARNQRGTFADAALLALDFSRPEKKRPPVLLAVGHSGCGTLTAIEALAELGGDFLQTLATHRRAGVVLSYNRKKRTKALIDDFTRTGDIVHGPAWPW